MNKSYETPKTFQLDAESAKILGERATGSIINGGEGREGADWCGTKCIHSFPSFVSLKLSLPSLGSLLLVQWLTRERRVEINRAVVSDNKRMAILDFMIDQTVLF